MTCCDYSTRGENAYPYCGKSFKACAKTPNRIFNKTYTTHRARVFTADSRSFHVNSHTVETVLTKALATDTTSLTKALATDTTVLTQ
jgi:hypothetical protein